MARYAAIDVGTNSVLLLVAERTPQGQFEAVAERAVITRLGRGVDASRRLAPEAIEETVAAIEHFAAEARSQGAKDLVVSATSAARDAQNGADFLTAARARAGVEITVISGDEEARLSFASAQADFGGVRPLVVVDIGGGSTEFIYGDVTGAISWRHSFDVGSVRLTERHLKGDPPSAEELLQAERTIGAALSDLPPPPPHFRLVGVAGTVTTVCSIARRVDPYDAAVVHGCELSRAEVDGVVERLAHLPVALRKTVPGLQPRRADVIVGGVLVLRSAMEVLGAASLTASDRGLRWGLLADRFGKAD